MDEDELNERIEKIRDWMFDNPKDKRIKTAMFALDVALCAREIKRNPISDITQLVIDNLM